METIAVANLKGGVGKTVITLNLGKLLSRRYKTLLIDLDSQGSLSSAFRMNGPEMGRVMMGEKPAPRKVGNNLDLLPADLSLSRTELALVSTMGRENVLKKALRGLDYELVLIDTPPSFGMLSVNGLNAADGVIIPVKPEGADLKGLSYFQETLDQVKENLNPELETLGVVLNFYDERLLHQEAGVAVLERLDYGVLGKIGRTVRVSESFTAGQSLLEYAASNRNTRGFIELSQEVVKWVNSRTK